MLKMFIYQNNGFTLENFLDYYYGNVTTGNRSQNDEFGQMNLYDALSQAKLVSSNLLFTLNELTLVLHALCLILIREINLDYRMQIMVQRC